MSVVSTPLAAFDILFCRNGDATHDHAAVLHSRHTLGNAAGMNYIFCDDVETNGDGAAATLMCSMASDLVILGIAHGVDLLNSFDDLL